MILLKFCVFGFCTGKAEFATSVTLSTSMSRRAAVIRALLLALGMIEPQVPRSSSVGWVAPYTPLIAAHLFLSGRYRSLINNGDPHHRHALFVAAQFGMAVPPAPAAAADAPAGAAAGAAAGAGGGAGPDPAPM